MALSAPALQWFTGICFFEAFLSGLVCCCVPFYAMEAGHCHHNRCTFLDVIIFGMLAQPRYELSGLGFACTRALAQKLGWGFILLLLTVQILVVYVSLAALLSPHLILQVPNDAVPHLEVLGFLLLSGLTACPKRLAQCYIRDAAGANRGEASQALRQIVLASGSARALGPVVAGLMISRWRLSEGLLLPAFPVGAVLMCCFIFVSARLSGQCGGFTAGNFLLAPHADTTFVIEDEAGDPARGLTSEVRASASAPPLAAAAATATATSSSPGGAATATQPGQARARRSYSYDPRVLSAACHMPFCPPSFLLVLVSTQKKAALPLWPQAFAILSAISALTEMVLIDQSARKVDGGRHPFEVHISHLEFTSTFLSSSFMAWLAHTHLEFQRSGAFIALMVPVCLSKYAACKLRLRTGLRYLNEQAMRPIPVMYGSLMRFIVGLWPYLAFTIWTPLPFIVLSLVSGSIVMLKLILCCPMPMRWLAHRGRSRAPHRSQSQADVEGADRAMPFLNDDATALREVLDEVEVSQDAYFNDHLEGFSEGEIHASYEAEQRSASNEAVRVALDEL